MEFIKLDKGTYNFFKEEIEKLEKQVKELEDIELQWFFANMGDRKILIEPMIKNSNLTDGIKNKLLDNMDGDLLMHIKRFINSTYYLIVCESHHFF